MRTDRLREEYELEVRWLAFPLHPEVPEDGVTLAELFAGASVDFAGIAAKMKRVAGELGLPLTDRNRTYNTRLAQEVGKWAESKGKGDQFHEAMFRAVFSDDRNIGKAAVLIDVAQSMGLSGEDASSLIELRTFRDAVDSDWSRSRALNIRAVPTFMLGDRKIAGFQPYDALEQFVRAGGARKRSSS